MSDAPPSYQQAISTGSTSAPTSASQRLQVPGADRNRIPPHYRRSIEDEDRPLPEGWVRQFDPKSNHQFFVDTKGNPPRSIWHHPYDDEPYLKTLPSEERERIEELSRGRQPSREDIIAAESDIDNDDHHPELPPRPSGQHSTDKPQGSNKFGRKLKDKLTGTTHEQRVEERRRQEAAEEEMYRRHQMLRQAMQRAFETGQPQLIGKDKDGNDVYVEPPRGGPFPQGRYGYNPYAQGPYRQPNSRFIPYPVPSSPYNRPYGPTYGYGMGMGAPLMGGLLGGALLGGLLF